jgi:hypothetical protein
MCAAILTLVCQLISRATKVTRPLPVIGSLQV